MFKSLRLAFAAPCLAIGLLGCATGGGGGGLPNPQDLQLALTAVETGWTVYCAQAGHTKVCSPANQQKVADAETTAQDALNTYAEAYNTGNATQALLDNLQADETAVLTLIQDFQKKGG